MLPSSAVRRKRWIAGILLPCALLSALSLFAENKSLKGDLEKLFSGKTLTSRIVFGGRAVPRGYQADYPVNTLVYPDSNQVSYRIEWGIMRTQVGQREMQRYFNTGTAFHVKDIDLKDDRLELKLESGAGDSARLKLMLGSGWQSKMDSSAIQAQLGQVFVLEQPAAAPQPTMVAAQSNPTGASTGIVVPASSVPQYQRNPSAPKIDGRISEDDFRVVLAAFDSEITTALAPMSRDAGVLASNLLAYQKAYGGFGSSGDYASRGNLQAIANLQDRLGKTLQPQRDEDLLQMNDVFRRCARGSQVGQARDEYGNLIGGSRNAGGFLKGLSAAVQVSNQLQTDMQVGRSREAAIVQTRIFVIGAEQALDKGDLFDANKRYALLAANPTMSAMAPVQQYLQRTAAFRADLASYAQVVQLDQRADRPLLQQLQGLRQESDMLTASAARPITQRYLQGRVQSDVTSAKAKIALLPTFQFDERAYRVSGGMSDSERAALLAKKIADLDGRLSAVGDLRGIVMSSDAIQTVAQLVGVAESAALKQKGAQIASAEQIRAEMAKDEQEAQQRAEVARAQAEAKAAAERAQVRAKLSAEIAARQQYAEELTQRMSKEIYWCAGGSSGELLAGYIAVARPSSATLSQLGAASPVWQELYAKGFKFSGVYDRDQTAKTAAITAQGAQGAPITAISEKDRGYLQHAIDVLESRAGGEESARSCIPAATQSACTQCEK